MTQKTVDLKGKKVLRSIELHKDLKPEAIRRLLTELSSEAAQLAKTGQISILIVKQ